MTFIDHLILCWLFGMSIGWLLASFVDCWQTNRRIKKLMLERREIFGVKNEED